ncbi:MAG TPA: TolC family protein, partial [Candidatus Angelobacter sp.]|nr:TolC family protein [Candidatus Angelobacter sp.]
MQGQSGAPPSGTVRLTLSQAVDYAVQHYPAVRISLARLAQAQANVGLAKTQYLPTANLLWQTNRATFNNIFGQLLPQAVIPSMSGPVLNSTSNASTWGSAGGALGTWQPFDFGLRHANVLQARAGANVAAQAANLTRLDVAQATANAYLAVAAARQNVVAAQANLDRWQTFAKSIHVLVDNQLRPGADASQADAELAAARTQLIQAQTAVKVAQSMFADLLEVPTSSLVLVPDSVLQLPASIALPAASLKQHPLALEQQANVDLAQSAVHILDRTYYPKFDLQGAYFGRGSGTDTTGHVGSGTSGLGIDRENWAVGLSVTFTPTQIFALHQQHKGAQANVQAQQAQYAQTLEDLNYGLEQAQSQLQGAQQIAQNTPVQLAAARASESQSQAQYKASLTTIVQVAQAESLLTQAEIEDAQARLNVWRALVTVAASQGD